MNFKREPVLSWHTSITMVVILMTVVLACASVIPAARACVTGLTYYANKTNPSAADFYRSATPFNFATAFYAFQQSVSARYRRWQSEVN